MPLSDTEYDTLPSLFDTSTWMFPLGDVIVSDALAVNVAARAMRREKNALVFIGMISVGLYGLGGIPAFRYSVIPAFQLFVHLAYFLSIGNYNSVVVSGYALSL